MSITVMLLTEVILVLLLALKMLYSRYRAQRDTIHAFLESDKLIPSKPNKISRKKKRKLVTDYLQQELKHCEEEMDANQHQKEAEGSEGDLESDKEALLVSIRRTLLIAEIRAQEQKLCPKKDRTGYWNHFAEHLMPLIERFAALTDQALEERDGEWHEKLMVLEKQVNGAEQSLAEITEERQKSEAERSSLEKKMEELLASQSMIAQLEEEKNAIASSMNEAPSETDENQRDPTEENQQHTAYDIELMRLKERSASQQNIINNLLDKIDQYKSTQEASKEKGPIELTEEDIEQLESLKTEAEQLNRMIKESEVIIQMLEGEIDELTQQLKESNTQFKEAKHMLTTANSELAEAKEAAENSEKVDALTGELEQAEAMQSMLIKSNSDYAVIIGFTQRALEAHSLQNLAEEVLQIFDTFNTEGGVEIYSHDIKITRETKQVNSTLIHECFKNSDTTGSRFKEKGSITLLCYPNIKVAVEKMDQMNPEDRDRLKESLPIISSLANEFISNINNEKEIELNRAKLKQTIVAVHQSARNLDIRLKLFFKEIAQESGALTKKLNNEAYRFKLSNSDRDRLLSFLNESIKTSSNIMDKHKTSTIITQLLQSVEPALNEIREANAKAKESDQ